MKAFIVDHDRIPRLAEFADPAQRDGLVVMTIRAAALTNLDLAVAEGRHFFSPSQLPAVIGREAVAMAEDGKRFFLSIGYTSAVRLNGGADASRSHLRDPSARGCGRRFGGCSGQRGPSRLASAIVARAHVARGKGCSARPHWDDRSDCGCRRLTSRSRPRRGTPAALAAMARGGRLVHVGGMLGPTIALSAQTMRRQCLDVLGFAYYHAPISNQVDAYARLCEAALAGRVSLTTENFALEEFATAWT